MSSSAISLVKPANHSRGKFISVGNLQCQTVLKCFKFKERLDKERKDKERLDKDLIIVCW